MQSQKSAFLQDQPIYRSFFNTTGGSWHKKIMETSNRVYGLCDDRSAWYLKIKGNVGASKKNLVTHFSTGMKMVN